MIIAYVGVSNLKDRFGRSLLRVTKDETQQLMQCGEKLHEEIKKLVDAGKCKFCFLLSNKCGKFVFNTFDTLLTDDIQQQKHCLIKR